MQHNHRDNQIAGIKTTDVTEVAERLAAVKRTDAAATLYPGDDAWPAAMRRRSLRGLCRSLIHFVVN
jgi:hypothetical protein